LVEVACRFCVFKSLVQTMLTDAAPCEIIALDMLMQDAYEEFGELMKTISLVRINVPAYFEMELTSDIDREDDIILGGGLSVSDQRFGPAGFCWADESESAEARQVHPQPQQSLEYQAVHNGGVYFPDIGTHSVLAFTRVSKASSKACRRLVKDVLLIRSEAVNNCAIPLKLTVSSKDNTLNCNEVMLQLDGQAFATLGSGTRYKVWMFANDVKPSEKEQPDRLGDGWSDCAIVDFAVRTTFFMQSGIDMRKLFATSGRYIYFGVLLVHDQ